ncbi:MAG: hypothetical protein ACRDPY_11935 [Streptosporangiaceae bacterium]
MTDVLPFPADLPALPQPSQLVVLGDMDALSHGLAEGSARGRASDARVWAVLEQVMLTASGMGCRRLPVRWAASSATARHHLDLMTRSANNVWSIRRGLDGADYALLEELECITAATISADRNQNTCRPADLVVLIGSDHIYAPAIRRLRLLGIPTWVLQPGRFIAADLYKAAAAVTRLVPPMAA